VCTFQQFIVKHLSLQHNHPIDANTFSLYPENRQPTGQLRQQTETMLSMGANPTLVTNFLHRQNCNVTARDVINIKQRIQFHGTPIEELQQVLQQPAVTFRISKDQQDRLQCVTFCTERQKELAAAYGGVLLMDGTYRINKYRMPLYTLAIVDNEGHGQPVAHAVIARKDTEHLQQFLETVKEWFGTVSPDVFVVDKDYAEINAIKVVFPDAAVHLCRFHVLKALSGRDEAATATERSQPVPGNQLNVIVICPVN